MKLEFDLATRKARFLVVTAALDALTYVTYRPFDEKATLREMGWICLVVTAVVMTGVAVYCWIEEGRE